MLPLVAAGLSFSISQPGHARARPIRGIASARETLAPPLTFETPVGAPAIAHSHNDFAQERPLETALENGYTSIEVDVTDRRGEVAVVHLGFWTYGTIRSMYLDRLQRLVDEKGSVYGDGKKFILWIEIRPFITGPSIVPYLKKVLDAYPMFAVFGKSGTVVRPGAVEAIVINDRAPEIFADRETAPACLGTNGVDLTSDPNEPFECWNYLHWSSSFDWDGTGKMPDEEWQRLNELQAGAHVRGHRTRYWGVPDTPEFWKNARKLPFDLVGTDDLRSTMEILRSTPVATPPAAGGTIDLLANRRGTVKRGRSIR